MSDEPSDNRSLTGQPGSEFTLFANEVNSGLARFDNAYRDFLAGHVDVAGSIVNDPVNDLVQRIAVSRAIIGRIDRIFIPEATARALGSPGQPGNPESARELADSIVTVFSTLLQWGRDARSAVVDPQWQTIYAALANFARQPLLQIRSFADDIAAKAEALRAELGAGRAPSTTMAITLEIAVGAGEMAALSAAIAVAEVVARPSRKRARRFRR